jgi:hypothetical protein
MSGRRCWLVDRSLARPGIRLRLADFPVTAIAVRCSQHWLDGFKIKRGLTRSGVICRRDTTKFTKYTKAAGRVNPKTEGRKPDEQQRLGAAEPHPKMADGRWQMANRGFASAQEDLVQNARF